MRQTGLGARPTGEAQLKQDRTETNEHGVPQYPKGDVRRLFVLLSAIDQLERPTLTSLANFTGHNKGTIDADVFKLREQFGVSIDRDGPVFRLRSWGEVLKKNGVKAHLRG